MTPPPLVAIVGRPNVGKSTLFNRLTGRRTALVSDMPGLTRDRRAEKAEIGGHAIQLVDTAGLEEAPPGTIPSRMRQQSEAAITAADVVLFVIDSRDGVTGADRQFAEVVRRSGKPAIVVANKCEGSKGNDGFYEAFALGLGEPVAISAEHGEGIGDLEADMIAALGLGAPVARPSRRKRAQADAPASSADPVEPAASLQTPPRALRIAVVGRPNAGKSTLVNALLGEERMITGPEPGLTRDAIATDLDWNGRPVRLFDTAGLRRRTRVQELAEKLSTGDTLRAVRFAEVVILVIDAERAFEHQDLGIADMVASEGRALVVAVNKWDLVPDKQRRLRDLVETVSEKMAQVPGVPVVPISALAEKGLDKLMAAVFQTYEVWNRRVPTPQLNRWLGEALERHAPPAQAGRRIKIRYMTQASARPPTFVAFCSSPEALPRSYERYLLNSLRETFDLGGVPIRLNMRKGANPYAKRK
ncbi:MAG: ribosome biogenesis GTPase Der [Hyphomicrobiaceae bacterium]